MLKKLALLVMFLGLGAAPLAWGQDNSDGGDETQASDESDDIDDADVATLDAAGDESDEEDTSEDPSEADDDSGDDSSGLADADDPTDDSSEDPAAANDEPVSRTPPAPAPLVAPPEPPPKVPPPASPPARPPPAPPPTQPSGTWRYGTVKFFDETKGFGVIMDVETQQEIFVHVSGLVDAIRAGDNVKFTVVQGRKGLTAVSVTVR